MELLRPYGIVLDGELRLGLEVLREDGIVRQIRAHTGVPDAYVLSVPFVNAHSHLEYRGLQGKLKGLGYWDWIRELTRLKALQTDEDVRADCRLAAQENRRTGVGLMGEHSDRPFAGEALAAAGIGGRIYQEVITFFERESREEKLAQVEARLQANRAAFGDRVELTPHALYTVDPKTLRMFGESERPFSIHVAESTFERAFFEKGEGPIAEFHRSNQVPFEAAGRSPVEVAHHDGLLRPGAQLVHCCDLRGSDIDLLSASGATVAHCPRSNVALGCPTAPIRELLEAGVSVGLGMDSAASSGPIDMFAEMRSAITAARERGRSLRGEEVWRMATKGGAASIGFVDWDFGESDKIGGWFAGPLLALEITDAQTTEDLIERGRPEAVRWIE